MVNHSKHSAKKLRRIEALLNLLSRRPEIRSWIRILSIGRKNVKRLNPQDHNFTSTYFSMEPKILQIVPELRNLNLLRCGLMFFSSSFFSHILRLPHLYELHFENIQFSQDTADQTPYWSTIGQDRLPLKILTLASLKPPSIRTTGALIHLLQQETLVELTSWPPVCLDLGTWVTLPRITLNHIPDFVFTSLRKLHISLAPSDVEVQYFVRFGARCPNLISLNISNHYVETPKQLDDLRHSTLAENPFPALQEFEGSLALAPVFVQGRPVHRVIGDICEGVEWPTRSGPTLASNLAALTPSVSLHVLSLATPHWNEADIEAIAQHHPGLEELVYEDFEGKVLVS